MLLQKTTIHFHTPLHGHGYKCPFKLSVFMFCASDERVYRVSTSISLIAVGGCVNFVNRLYSFFGVL